MSSSETTNNDISPTIPPPESEIPAPVQVQTPEPAVNHLRRESIFLSLAPVLSIGYPTQASIQASQAAIMAKTVPLPEQANDGEEHLHKTRRSSSVASDNTQRFLRLGPTFGGERFDDFADMV